MVEDLNARVLLKRRSDGDPWFIVRVDLRDVALIGFICLVVFFGGRI